MANTYRFVDFAGRRFGVRIAPVFCWFYLHGGSSRKAGGIRIGKFEVVW